MIKNDTEKREILMDALLQSPNVSKAADKAKVSRATVYRWLADAGFAEELKQKRNAMLDSAIESVKCHSGKAADTLAAMLISKDERLRRMAAKDLLDYSFKILENRDLLHRLDAIEAQITHGAHNNRPSQEALADAREIIMEGLEVEPD